MAEQMLDVGKKVTSQRVTITLLFLIFITDVAILLDIPYLRQIFGFLFLTILPGLLILRILKLDKIDLLEKFVLFWGLSISFLMLFGVLFNNISLSLGYETPLSTISLLISFNFIYIILTAIGYKLTKNSFFSIPNLNLTTAEKAFLIVPVIFPALSIFGMHVMNTSNNNIFLICLIFLISIYVAFVCFFNQAFPKRLYPVVIFLIGISLLLLLALRSNHIIGVDAHAEYYFFRTTSNNLHWDVEGYSLLDPCLSITILPTIYQSILNINREFQFRIFYPLIFSIIPLVVYVLSKKYVEEGYAFLASCFSMFQVYFLWIEHNPRTSVAILFFALAMVTLFSGEISPLKKRLLFILFMASCVVSHYSTAYVFFIILLGTFIGIEVVSKKHIFKKLISLTSVVLFFALIFFWYSQITKAAFSCGVDFIGKTLSNLNLFFIEESRSSGVSSLMGGGSVQKGIPYMIEFVFTWLTFAFIGIGIVTVLIKYKEMLFLERNFKKPDFLKKKFDVEYFFIALCSVGLLVIMVILPHLSIGYDMFRLYPVTIVILAIFFVIGGIIVSKAISFTMTLLVKKLCYRKKSLAKRKSILRNNREKNPQIGAYLIMLLVLIPYFLCATDVTYTMMGFPRSIILNSEREQVRDVRYIHDEEVIAANWLTDNNVDDLTTYTDVGGHWRLNLECDVGKRPRINRALFAKDQKIGEGYIHLGYFNVVEGIVHLTFSVEGRIKDYLHLFVGKSKIYANGYSEIWMCGIK